MPYWLRRISIIAMLVSWVVAHSSAQDTAIDAVITPASLKYLVQQFSADSFQGRLSGTAAATKASELIAREFAKAGLQPLGDNGTYVRPFMLPSNAIAYTVWGGPFLPKTKTLISPDPVNRTCCQIVNPLTGKLSPTLTFPKIFVFQLFPYI
jgi:hypothetical protein